MALGLHTYYIYAIGFHLFHTDKSFQVIIHNGLFRPYFIYHALLLNDATILIKIR